MRRAALVSIVISLLALTLLVLVSSCSPASPAIIITQTPPNADAITENILTSLQNNDYDGFSRDFDDNLKGVINKTTFDQLNLQVKTNAGDYVSKQFFSFSVQGKDTTMIYIARYSKEPAGVLISVVFEQVSSTYHVHGLNLDSPRLRGQPIDVTRIRSYADGITENVLVSLNGNNYTGFIGDMDDTMKKAESKPTFDQLHDLIKSTVGDYLSKDFQSATTQDKIDTLRYLAKYSDEPASVWVTISFDANHQVAGLYFNSPKLAATARNVK